MSKLPKSRLYDLSKKCRFDVSAPGEEYAPCNEPVTRGHYCDKHAKIMYYPPRKVPQPRSPYVARNDRAR
jgi:hypothetical protein